MPSAVHHYLSGHPIVVGVVIAPIVHSVFLCNGLLLCDCIDAAHGIPVQRDRRAMRPCVMRVIGTNLDVPEAPFPDTALSRVLRMLTLRVEPHGPNPILSAFRGRRNDVGLSSRGGCHRDRLSSMRRSPMQPPSSSAWTVFLFERTWCAPFSYPIVPLPMNSVNTDRNPRLPFRNLSGTSSRYRLLPGQSTDVTS